jgi:hypothetical protein
MEFFAGFATETLCEQALETGITHSAAFISNPSSILSEGATG